MIKDIVLSGRLQAAASMVESCDTFTDIGTDHAFLPIWLIAHDVCHKAVAADINKGPLSSARSNASYFGIDEDRISFVLSDGLKSIGDPGKGYHVLAITGMGGLNISGILEAGEEKTGYYSSFIFSPHTKQAELRRYLIGKGFIITDEKYVIDDEKLYVIIKSVLPDKNKNTGATDHSKAEYSLAKYSVADHSTAEYSQAEYSATDYRFGRFINKALEDESIREYLDLAYGKLCRMIGENSSIPKERLTELDKEVQCYKEVLGI